MEDGTSMSVAHTGVRDGLPVDTGGAHCELRSVLDRIGDKWSVLVIVLLSGGATRYSELHRAMPGISQRMLTLTVRNLERDGLIQRTVYAEVPPRVDYRLTPLGVTLLEPIRGLADWITEHGHAVLAARADFDQHADRKSRLKAR